jgi:hypothetical protein
MWLNAPVKKLDWNVVTGVLYGLVMACAGVLLVDRAFAAETDQFYAWGKPLTDSTVSVNGAMNSLIDQALAQADPKDKCVDVATAIGKFMQKSDVFHGVHESWDDEHFPIDSIPKSDPASIEHYKANNIYALMLPHDKFQGKYVHGNFSETISMAGVRFGLDKLLHFAVVGGSYHRIYRALRKSGVGDAKARHAVIWAGVQSEKSLLGLQGTGVFSYADMEANMQGFNWYH